MLEVDRGPVIYRPEIHWLHPHDVRVPLKFYAVPGERLEVELLHSWVLVLDILAERWILDVDVILAYRGFVHVVDIARAYERRAGRTSSIDPNAIVRYISRTHKVMAEAVGSDRAQLPVRLVENRRGVGYRIAGCGLRIHDPFRAHPRAHARANMQWC